MAITRTWWEYTKTGWGRWVATRMSQTGSEAAYDTVSVSYFLTKRGAQRYVSNYMKKVRLGRRWEKQ